MTGGYTIIKIEGPNGERITPTTVSQSLKAGTFERITRAKTLGKPVLITNLYASDLKERYTSFYLLMETRNSTDAMKAYFFRRGYTASNATTVNEVVVVIKDSDEIVSLT